MRLEEYHVGLFEIVESLALRMKDEGAHSRYGWNSEKLRQLLDHPDVYCVLVRDDDGYFGGMIGMASRMFFSDDITASDLGIFILPEKRGGSAALKLILAFETWARSKGAIEVCLGQTTGVEIDKTRRLYEGMGYRVVGVSAKKEI